MLKIIIILKVESLKQICRNFLSKIKKVWFAILDNRIHQFIRGGEPKDRIFFLLRNFEFIEKFSKDKTRTQKQIERETWAQKRNLLDVLRYLAQKKKWKKLQSFCDRFAFVFALCSRKKKRWKETSTTCRTVKLVFLEPSSDSDVQDSTLRLNWNVFPRNFIAKKANLSSQHLPSLLRMKSARK